MATLTSNLNFLQPTGFKVVISRTNYPNIEYFVQSITHPGATVPAVEVPSLRIRSVPVAGDKIAYDELSLTLVLDENMESYKEMHSWLERIVNFGQVNQRDIPPEDQIPTFADITLSILSSHNNENVKFRYKDCVPTGIGTINFTSVENTTYTTFDATFRFSTFEIL